MKDIHRPQVPSRPATVLPRGAWDCHVHVFGSPSRFPLSPLRRYTPGIADTRDLKNMMERMGIAHAVLVQATAYGEDHSCLVHALRQLGTACVGVASFPPRYAPTDKELNVLDDAGVVALRVHTLSQGQAEASAIALSALAMVQDRGWQLEVQCDGDQLELIEQLGSSFDGPIVLDHIARITPESLDHLIGLARQLPVYVKLSGLYRNPRPDKAAFVAREILSSLPDRVVWGSDWPHTPLAGGRSVEPGSDSFLSINATSIFDAVFAGTSASSLEACLRRTPEALYLPNARTARL